MNKTRGAGRSAASSYAAMRTVAGSRPVLVIVWEWHIGLALLCGCSGALEYPTTNSCGPINKSFLYIYIISRLTGHTLCVLDVWSGDLQVEKSIVIHDTECSYCGQVSLKKTNSNPFTSGSFYLFSMFSSLTSKCLCRCTACIIYIKHNTTMEMCIHFLWV